MGCPAVVPFAQNQDVWQMVLGTAIMQFMAPPVPGNAKAFRLYMWEGGEWGGHQQNSEQSNCMSISSLYSKVEGVMDMHLYLLEVTIRQNSTLCKHGCPDWHCCLYSLVLHTIHGDKGFKLSLHDTQCQHSMDMQEGYHCIAMHASADSC